MTGAWTVKQLRDALADLPDEAPVRVATRTGGAYCAHRVEEVTYLPEVDGAALTDRDPEEVEDLLDQAEWVLWIASRAEFDSQARQWRRAPWSAWEEGWRPG